MILKSGLVRFMGGSHYDHLHEMAGGMNLAIQRWEGQVDGASQEELLSAREDIQRALRAHDLLGTHSSLLRSPLPDLARALRVQVEARLLEVKTA